MTQREWDEFLLMSFYRRPFLSMNHAADLKGVAGLLRAPKKPHHEFVSVSRFICGYLPKLADILWQKKEKDIPAILDMLEKSKYDTRLVDPKEVSDSREKTASKRKFRSSVYSVAADMAANERLARRAWNVCKP